MRGQYVVGSVLSLLCLVTTPTVAFAQASTLSKAVRTHENMEPAVPRPAQDQLARKKPVDFDGTTTRMPEFTAPDLGRETFDVGRDLGSPVSLDYFDRRPFAFAGRIETVTVELTP